MTSVLATGPTRNLGSNVFDGNIAGGIQGVELSPNPVLLDFWSDPGQMESVDSFQVRLLGAKTPRDYVTCLDIEHFPPTDTATIPKLIRIIHLLRESNPNLKMGYYMLIPERDYWSPVLADYNPIYQERVDAWKLRNDSLSPLAKEVDVLYPSLYTFYDDSAAWRIYARANLEESKRNYHKPVISYLWPLYHSSSTLAGQYLDTSYWRMQLELADSLSDGIVIYGESVDGAMPWAQTTLNWWLSNPTSSHYFRSGDRIDLKSSVEVGRGLFPGDSSWEKRSVGDRGFVSWGPSLWNGQRTWYINFDHGSDGWVNESALDTCKPWFVGHWDLDSAKAWDGSGDANHGVVFGEPLTTPGVRSGENALAFNGVNQFVVFGSSPRINPQQGDFTIGAWMRLDSGALTHGTILSNNLAVDNYPGFHFGYYYGQFGLQMRGVRPEDSTILLTCALPTVGANQWQHISAQREGSTLRLFLNGELLCDSTFTRLSPEYSVSTQASVLSAGATVYFNRSRFFKGSMDELYLAMRAMTQTEIQELSAHEVPVVYRKPIAQKLINASQEKRRDLLGRVKHGNLMTP